MLIRIYLAVVAVIIAAGLVRFSLAGEKARTPGSSKEVIKVTDEDEDDEDAEKSDEDTDEDDEDSLEKPEGKKGEIKKQEKAAEQKPKEATAGAVKEEDLVEVKEKR